MSFGNSDNEGIILSIIQRLGSCDQKQIIAFANQVKPFSQPNVSKILSKLEKHGIIESKLSGNGHEKLYSLKQSNNHEEPIHSGIILPPQQRISEAYHASIQYPQPSYSIPSYPNDNRPIVTNGTCKKVVDAWTYDTNGNQIPYSWHWEIS